MDEEVELVDWESSVVRYDCSGEQLLIYIVIEIELKIGNNVVEGVRKESSVPNFNPLEKWLFLETRIEDRVQIKDLDPGG